MNGAAPVRRFALAALLLGLVAIAACGQMGPLQLPDPTAPVAAENGDDEDREADER